MRVYSQDFRDSVLNLRKNNALSMAVTAKRCGVNIGTIYKWVHNPVANYKRNRPCLKIDMDALMIDVKLYPYATLKQRAEKFQVSLGCICGAFKRLNIKRISDPSGNKYVLPECNNN